MKKLIYTSALALVLGASASAKTADELRIYINPGHGGWTANDRPCVIVGHEQYTANGTDTTNFFESNTNLEKGFGVLEQLIKYGFKFDRTLNQTGDNLTTGAARDLSNNLVMSRVKNGPYSGSNTGSQANSEVFDRSLSEICAEVEANNFDMFISIHSNAASEGTTTNYPLFLYRGYDTPVEETGVSLEQQNTSIDMAKACWPYAIGNTQAVWTAYKTGTNIRGDINFYGSSSTGVLGYKGYLGVLKHGTPGFLVEGYFHTYQPARHRAMNWDVCRVEGIAYARGIADYFGVTKTDKGLIYGIVRDIHEKFSHQYYKANPTSDDVYMPINGCTVTLKKDGAVIATKVTDNNYNGAFVFDDLDAGEYTLEFSHPDYKAIDPVAVTVSASADSYPTAFMENVNYVPPIIVYENYPDPVTTDAIRGAEEYVMQQAYVDEPIAELEGKTIRRTILKDNMLYVLALDAENAPTLVVYDFDNKTVVANVSTEGCDGTELNVSDIQLTADGYLLACNKELTQYDASQMEPTDIRRGTFYIYKWAKDETTGLPTGNPEQWLSSQHTGNWYRSLSGDTFAYSGTSDEGMAVFSCETWYGSKALRTMVMPVVSGQKASESFHQPMIPSAGGVFGVDKLGDDYRFVTSPLNDNNYYVVGSGDTPVIECEFMHDNGSDVTAKMNEGVLANATPRASMFKYAGKTYMVAPVTDDSKNTGIKLVDITGGIANAKVVSTVNTTIEEADLTNVSAAGVTIVDKDDNDNVTDANINLYLVRGNKVSKFTTAGAEQPVNRGEWAYGFKLESTGKNTYNAQFSLTGDAHARVELVPVAEGDIVVVADQDYVKGENTCAIDATELSGKYNWQVVVESGAIARVGMVYKDSNPASRGVAIDKNPESPYFGNAYTSDPYSSSKGIYMYTPALEKVNNAPYQSAEFAKGNTASPYRLSVLPSGTVMIADWSDAHAGIWKLDPADPENVANMFAGTCEASGAFRYEGQIIGGGSTGQSTIGTGEDTKLYAFIEDYPTGNAGNQLVRYDIGEKETIDFKPNAEYPTVSGLLINTNVCVEAYDQALLVAQNRSTGNNGTNIPAFMILDHDANILFNSGNLENFDGGTGGVALNADGTMFAAADSEASGKIHIFNITWEPAVSLEEVYSFSFNEASEASNSTNYAYQLQFDPAGNLYVASRAGFRVFSLPNEAPVATTSAKAEQIIEGALEGVESISVEAAENDAPVVYYNLQGVKVASDNLTPGVYVKVQGNVATKVVVK